MPFSEQKTSSVLGPSLRSVVFPCFLVFPSPNLLRLPCLKLWPSLGLSSLSPFTGYPFPSLMINLVESLPCTLRELFYFHANKGGNHLLFWPLLWWCHVLLSCCLTRKDLPLLSPWLWLLLLCFSLTRRLSPSHHTRDLVSPGSQSKRYFGDATGFPPNFLKTVLTIEKSRYLAVNFPSVYPYTSVTQVYQRTQMDTDLCLRTFFSTCLKHIFMLVFLTQTYTRRFVTTSKCHLYLVSYCRGISWKYPCVVQWNTRSTQLAGKPSNATLPTFSFQDLLLWWLFLSSSQWRTPSFFASFAFLSLLQMSTCIWR